ncbi:sulfotransferase [Stenotrophomonas terrae]|uniref:tetratricopeptide repeat-containing sulfotransferase family protein n=1 Tax=Stenotrophomonas terrae TaxID=405446 RepID=UPI00320B260C
MSQQVMQLYARAVEALNRKQWREAWAVAQHLLESGVEHGGVHFVAGVAAMELGHMKAAIVHLRMATRISPERADYATQMARLLVALRAPQEAFQYAEAAAALEPEDAHTLDTLGVVFTRLNEHVRALEAFTAAVGKLPGEAVFHYNHATSLLFSGRIADAESAYRRCLELAPTYWRAYTSLANLRRWRSDENNVALYAQALELAGQSSEGCLYVNLALAKELEDVGDYPSAFASYTKAKDSQKSLRNYQSEKDLILFEGLREAFDGVGDVSPGAASEEPIFVVGMPRSGTTLVERIVSSHPDVHSAGELENFPVTVKRFSGTRTNAVTDIETMIALHGIDWKALGEAYVESTRPGTAGCSRFVDKLPHNFLYLGHIAMALPAARIVLLRRDSMDTCLSNFRQLFSLTSSVYDYSFDLLDTGRYYQMFDRLMRYWCDRLGDRILIVNYEDLVDDQEGQTRRIIEFCGLEWNDACLRFEENAAPVATASVVQVRSKVTRDYIGRWKRYGAAVDPLAQLLTGESGSSV